MSYKIALVHDYLSQDGGAERVLRVFHEVWPEAPIYVMFYDREKKHLGFDNAEVRTSFLEKLPGWKKYYQWYMPLMPRAVESYDLSEFDVVLSSTSAFAKGVKLRPDAVHVCYCHTPTRFLWTETQEYIKNLKYPFFIKKLLPLYFDGLRNWDARIARERVDHFIANSKNVSERIAKYYGRVSEVIYPPLELQCPVMHIPQSERNYFLAGGRLVPYKKFDLIIEVFNRLGWPLKIFGTGREENKLKKIAGPNIEFLGHIPDQEKCALYANAKAYINPQEEDFGITVIEAMMQGCPVIAYGKGGATESVVSGLSGVFFDEQNWDCLLHCVLNFDSTKFDPIAIAQHAQKYSKDKFIRQLRNFVESKLDSKKTNLEKS